MRILFEEYGGVLLACVASLAVLTMNMLFFLGPVAEGITVIVKQCY